MKSPIFYRLWFTKITVSYSSKLHVSELLLFKQRAHAPGSAFPWPWPRQTLTLFQLHLLLGLLRLGPMMLAFHGFAIAIEFSLVKQAYLSEKKKNESNSRQVHTFRCDKSGWGGCEWLKFAKESAVRTEAVVWFLGLRDTQCFSAKTKNAKCECACECAWVCVCERESCLIWQGNTARCNRPHVRCKPAFAWEEMRGRACFLPIRSRPEELQEQEVVAVTGPSDACISPHPFCWWCSPALFPTKNKDSFLCFVESIPQSVSQTGLWRGCNIPFQYFASWK